MIFVGLEFPYDPIRTKIIDDRKNIRVVATPWQQRADQKCFSTKQKKNLKKEEEKIPKVQVVFKS
jgi:hypothetical protein